MKTTPPKFAWNRGKTDKSKGFVRVSPFYEDDVADYFWFAGWDGRTFEEAQQTLVDKEHASEKI